MWTYITRTDNAKLRLKVTAPLSEEEWGALTASLASLRFAVVSQGAQTVTKLLEDLQEAPLSPEEEEEHAISLWAMQKHPTAEQILGRQTFMGPLDASHMGLRLRVGDKAVLTPSHGSPAHADVMHRWVAERVGSTNYVCSHAQCWATVEVTTA